MKRTVIREHVFRILFRYEFYDKNDFEQQKALYFDEYPDLSDYPEVEDCRVISPLDRAEIESRVNDVVAHLNEIDEKIEDVCVNWKLSRIGKSELSILRLAAYEIMFDKEVEPAVAINEAVILSKKYCDEKSHAFVNGVLAKMI